MNWILAAQDLVRPLWAKVHPVAINAAIDRVWTEKVTDEFGDDRHIPVRDDGAAAAFRRLTQNK